MGGENGSIGSLTRAAMGALNGYGAFVGLFLLILLGYAVFKVFFANLRRGGILLIQIAVGSLYFFSVPRGYLDGFWNWGKQVAGPVSYTHLDVYKRQGVHPGQRADVRGLLLRL